MGRLTIESLTAASRCVLLGVLGLVLIRADAGEPVVADESVWNNALRSAYFGEREITESDQIIALDAPERAADPAFVPISITAGMAQSETRYIERIFLVIDKNPGPLVGTFHFTPRSGRADLDLRVRVNEYSMVRAIAETNDGELYMTKRFVKATGGCSAPIGTDLEAAMARLGKTKLRMEEGQADAEQFVRLMISHPNTTGMQMDQLTRLYSPAHFVTRVVVRFEGEDVFSADTSFAVSENPNFRFYFVPQHSGELTAEIVDSKGLRYEQRFEVSAAQAAAHAPR